MRLLYSREHLVSYSLSSFPHILQTENSPWCMTGKGNETNRLGREYDCINICSKLVYHDICVAVCNDFAIWGFSYDAMLITCKFSNVLFSLNWQRSPNHFHVIVQQRNWTTAFMLACPATLPAFFISKLFVHLVTQYNPGIITTWVKTYPLSAWRSSRNILSRPKNRPREWWRRKWTDMRS